MLKATVPVTRVVLPAAPCSAPLREYEVYASTCPPRYATACAAVDPISAHRPGPPLSGPPTCSGCTCRGSSRLHVEGACTPSSSKLGAVGNGTDSAAVRRPLRECGALCQEDVGKPTSRKGLSQESRPLHPSYTAPVVRSTLTPEAAPSHRGPPTDHPYGRHTPGHRPATVVSEHHVAVPRPVSHRDVKYYYEHVATKRVVFGGLRSAEPRYVDLSAEAEAGTFTPGAFAAQLARGAPGDPVGLGGLGAAEGWLGQGPHGQLRAQQRELGGGGQPVFTASMSCRDSLGL